MYDVRIKLDRLEKTVVGYENSPVQEGLIMFYGDSAFTRWKTMEQDIRHKDGSQAVVNHGFGGSTSEELLYYYDRLVKPWKPQTLVVNAFSNDRDVAYTPDEIMTLQARLLEWARKDFPGIRFYLCEVRPLQLGIAEKAVWHLQWQRHQLDYNKLLAQYCAEHEDCTLVSYINHPLFFDNPENIGDYYKIRTDVFLSDQVHYNETGYEMFKEFWLEQLDDIL